MTVTRIRCTACSREVATPDGVMPTTDWPLLHMRPIRQESGSIWSDSDGPADELCPGTWIDATNLPPRDYPRTDRHVPEPHGIRAHYERNTERKS